MINRCSKLGLQYCHENIWLIYKYTDISVSMNIGKETVNGGKDMIYVNVSKHLPNLFPIHHYFGKMLNLQIDT